MRDRPFRDEFRGKHSWHDRWRQGVVQPNVQRAIGFWPALAGKLAALANVSRAEARRVGSKDFEFSLDDRNLAASAGPYITVVRNAEPGAQPGAQQRVIVMTGIRRLTACDSDGKCRHGP